MVKVKKTAQTSLKIKEGVFSGDLIIDKDGEQVNLISALKAAFGDGVFTLTASNKTEEEIPVDEED